jgi:uncharacterized lipoprotein YmbA
MMRIGFLKTVTIVVTFTALLLTGCGSSSPKVAFYTLNPLTAMQAEEKTPATDQKLSIGVGPVESEAFHWRRSGGNSSNA